MSHILAEVEDAFLTFVLNRIDETDYRHIHSARDILRRMTDDDEYEMKEHMFELLTTAINWETILDKVASVAEEEEEEEETQSEGQSEDESCG